MQRFAFTLAMAIVLVEYENFAAYNFLHLIVYPLFLRKPVTLLAQSFLDRIKLWVADRSKVISFEELQWCLIEHQAFHDLSVHYARCILL